MRVLVASGVLLGIALVAIAPSRTSAQEQSPQAEIRSGEKLSLAFEGDQAGRPCTVIGVRGDFVGCRTEPRGIGQPVMEQWYNLRFVARIDRPAPQR